MAWMLIQDLAIRSLGLGWPVVCVVGQGLPPQGLETAFVHEHTSGWLAVFFRDDAAFGRRLSRNRWHAGWELREFLAPSEV